MIRFRKNLRWLLPAVNLLLVGCRDRPEAIDYGIDECTHCKMLISDKQFGAELITAKGRIYKFDSIECMAAYYRTAIRPEDVGSLWAIDYAHPAEWVQTDRALFLHSRDLPSPMGLYLSAFGSVGDLDDVKEHRGGRILNWNEVVQLVEHAWRDADHTDHKM
jgi:copper chaperone NosL